MFVSLFALLSAPASAGTPLLCHPYDIGESRSLPFEATGGRGDPDPRYDTAHLATDVLALLDERAPVMAHMETIRRATVYATKDPAAGRELLDALEGRARAGGALGQFDYGFLLATYAESAKAFGPDGVAAPKADGTEWVDRAIAARPDDAAMEYARALLSIWPHPDETDRLLATAIEDARKDPLVAKNILERYADRGATLDAIAANLASR